MRTLLNIPVYGIILAVLSCNRPSESRINSESAEAQSKEVTLKRDGIVTVHHPNQVPSISLIWEEDGFVVNQNLGRDGAMFSMSGNVMRVWMKGQKEGRVWIKRNSSDDEIVTLDFDRSDRSLYEDFDGDGIVDYKRNSDGVFRVAEIVWEKIGDIPDVPPDAPNHRVDTHIKQAEAQQDGTGQPATRSQSKSEGGDKPQPEAEGRSR